jgi:hypothetical protein
VAASAEGISWIEQNFDNQFCDLDGDHDGLGGRPDMITSTKRMTVASLALLTLSAVARTTPAAGGTWRGGGYGGYHGGYAYHGGYGGYHGGYGGYHGGYGGGWAAAAGVGLVAGVLGAALAAPHYSGDYSDQEYYSGYGNSGCSPGDSMYHGC